MRSWSITARRGLLAVGLVAFAACSSGSEADAPSVAPTSDAAGADVSVTSEPESEVAACPTAPAPGVERGTVETDDGLTRDYAIDMPERREIPPTLVVDLHELGNDVDGQLAADRWGSIIEDEGVVVVYPQGTEVEPGGSTVWYASADGENAVDDSAFVGRLIEQVVEIACIDSDRIHLIGFSMGAGLAALVACEHPDLVASAVTITGRFVPATASCDGDAEVPLLHVHGDADPVADYATTRGRVEEWALERGCEAGTAPTPLADDVVREDFQTCAADLAIVTIRGGGHQRPGDPKQLDVERFGPQSNQVSTATLAWQWFQAHPPKENAGEG